MTLSVVIPAFNAATTLPLTLQCLAAQTVTSTSAQIVVVDDGSTDGTSEYLRCRQLPIDVTVVTHRNRLGRSSARNSGRRVSTGDILVFLDADMLPAPTLLQSYLYEFSDPTRQVVAGWRRNIDAPAAPEIAEWLAAKIGVERPSLLRVDVEKQFDRLRALSRVGQYPTERSRTLLLATAALCEQDSGHIGTAFSFITSNVGIRTELFDRQGGFDPFIPRQQDLQFGVGLWELGAQFNFCPEGEAIHLHSPEDRRLLSDAEKAAFLLRYPYWPIARWLATSSGDSMFELLARNDVTEDDYAFVTTLIGRATCMKAPRGDAHAQVRAACGVDAEEATRCIEGAMADGILTGPDGKFDLNLVVNHARRRTLRLRQEKSECEPAITGRPASVIIEWRMCPRLLTAEDCEGILCDFPLPTAVQWWDDTAWEPASLRRCLDKPNHILRAVPVRAHETLRFRACVTLDRSNSNVPPSPADTRVTYSQTGKGLLETVAAQVGYARRASRAERLQRITSWLSAYTTHRDNACGDEFILESGFGNQQQRARLLLNLCRFSGIPARIRFGAVFGAKGLQPDLRLGVWNGTSNPLARSWIEAWLDGVCWHVIDVDMDAANVRICDTSMAPWRLSVANSRWYPPSAQDLAFVGSFHLNCEFAPAYSSIASTRP